MSDDSRKKAIAAAKPHTGGEKFLGPVLDSLSAHIAILDRGGRIIKTNRAWNEFAVSNDLKGPEHAIGMNYLDVCSSSKGESSEGAEEAATGLRYVMEGQEAGFVMFYPCHSPTEQRFFYLRITPVEESGLAHVVVSHENVTALKMAEEEIRKREALLAKHNVKLQEANTALRVLLEQREIDKRELQENLVANVKETVIPQVGRLRRSKLTTDQTVIVDLVEEKLLDVVSPFVRQLATANLMLTPQEVQVANYVRDGMATKEISELLHISPNAVDFHRKNIRKKLGLTNKRANLRTYLLSLDGNS